MTRRKKIIEGIRLGLLGAIPNEKGSSFILNNGKQRLFEDQSMIQEHFLVKFLPKTDLVFNR